LNKFNLQIALLLGALVAPPVFAEKPTDFHTVIVGPGETVENIDFGNMYRFGEIRGTKWNDLNGNGVRDQNEPGLEGVTIYLDLNENGVLDKEEPTQTTDKLGKYQFTKLVAGTYLVREVVPAGYRQTFPLGKSVDPYVRADFSYSPKNVNLGENMTFGVSVTDTNMEVTSADTNWTVKVPYGKPIRKKGAKLTYLFDKEGIYVVEAEIQGHFIAQKTISVFAIPLPINPPLSIPPNKTMKLTFPVPKRASMGADIVFVVDQSASYKDDIVTFKQKAKKIVHAFNNFGEDVQYALTGFADYPEFGGTFPYKFYQQLTKDENDFIQKISELQTYTGGPKPRESQLKALYQTVQDLHWRKGSLKIIFLATDADFQNKASNKQYAGPSFSETLSALSDNNITVYGLASGKGMTDLINFSQATGGETYKLSADSSGIVMQIEEALKALQDSGFLMLKADNQDQVKSIKPEKIAFRSAGADVDFTATFKEADSQRKFEQTEFNLFLKTDKNAFLLQQPMILKID